MKTYVSTHTRHHLSLDASKSADNARVELTVVDKSDPDTWYMTFSENKVDDFVTYINPIKSDQPASIYFHIISDEPLTFAKAGTTKSCQVFQGVLFAVGNEELQKNKAIKVESEGNKLCLSVLPNKFWRSPGSKNRSGQAGSKIGFRFVLQDEKGNVFYSHDPVIIVPDWEIG